MRRYFSLAKIVLLPYIRLHSLRIIITLFGIALGVGVFIAVQSASVSVRQSMRSLIGVISSGADIEITLDRGGFSEDVFSMISDVEGIKLAYPITVNRTRVELGTRSASVFVFGIDITKRRLEGSVSLGAGDFDMDSFLSLPSSVLVGRGFLESHGITRTSRLSVITAKGKIDCYIAGVIAGNDPVHDKTNVIFMDIFASQYLFNKEGKLDRIDIELEDGVDREKVKEDLARVVDARARVRDAGGQLAQFGNFYKSFDLNLTVVSFISLLLAIYLIVNTLNTAIFQQRKDIGILRSLGASRKDVVILFLLKGLSIGICGSLFGVILGYFLSYFSLKAFSEILYYTLLEDSSFSLSFDILLLGFALGVLVSFFASLLAVLNNFRTMPVYNIRAFARDKQASGIKIRLLFYTGCILLVLSYISSRQDIVFDIPFFGFLANFLIILGFSFLIPFLIELKLGFIRDYFRAILLKFRNTFELYLGIQNMGGLSLGKNSIAVATLMISIALIINISILIESYHYSIENWFRNVNNADVSIVSGSSYAEGDIFSMSEDRLSSLGDLSPYIDDIDYYRFRVVSFSSMKESSMKGSSMKESSMKGSSMKESSMKGSSMKESSMKGSSPRRVLVDLHSFDLETARKYVNYSFLEGDRDSSFLSMEKEDGILLSENLARQFDLGLGDIIYLNIGDDKAFKIAGVVVNYLSSKGIVSMSRKTYKKYFSDSSVDIFKIYLKAGTDIELFREKFYETVRDTDTLIFSSMSEFKGKVLSAIDNTFLMFHVLSFITVLIALMGIINTLLASIVDRKREIGILKAIGADRGQVIRIMLSQSVFIGIFSTILGVLSGFLLSFVTVFIINKQTVGWHLEYSFSFIFVLVVFLLFVLMSVLAGYYPAYRASLILAREALEYE